MTPHPLDPNIQPALRRAQALAARGPDERFDAGSPVAVGLDDWSEGADDGRDAMLLPEGDASELDDIDDAPVAHPGAPRANGTEHWIDRIGRARELEKALRGQRILGRLARIDRGTLRALVRVLPDQPWVATDLVAFLPSSVALDLGDKAFTTARLNWLREGEGKLIAFGLMFDSELTPKAIGARDAGEEPVATQQPDGL